MLVLPGSTGHDSDLLIQMLLTNVTLPETIYQRIALANLANRSFFIRSTLTAFESSASCTPQFVASMPDLGKTLVEKNGKMVKSSVPLKFSREEIRGHKRVAKLVAGGSLSLLTSAALHWQAGAKA